MTTAIVFFVKTPGISPLKTRLAKIIGQDKAEEFFILSIKVLEDLALKMQSKYDIEAYWSVMEAEGMTHPMWQKLKVIHPRGKGLGALQSNIYSQLLSKHDEVILMGGDCPQITEDIIIEAIDKVKGSDKFVFGPAEDGGYYLFGGNKNIPLDIWDSVEYSRNTTMEKLKEALSPISLSEDIGTLCDVDEYKDLLNLRGAMYHKNTPAVRDLESFLKKI